MDPQQPSTPATSSSKETAMSDSPPKYVPQFSATTEMILKRINGGVGTASLSSTGITGTPPGYEDMRRSVLMSMKTSHNMEIPSPPLNARQRNQGGRASVGSASSAGGAVTAPKMAAAAFTQQSQGQTPGSTQKNGTPASGGKGKAKAKARAGTKRKRAKDESDSSSSESIAMSGLGGDSDSDGSGSLNDFPKMTQSGRAVNKPAQFVPSVSDSAPRKRGPSKRTQEHALCKRCGRGHSPSSNMIVFCDGCNLGWHQMCHDPAVSEEDVKDESAPWFCADCSRKRGIKKQSPAEQLKGVSWTGRSTEEKRKYLSSLTQPQLVNLLLHTTTLHPSLPIFPVTPSENKPMQAYLPPQHSQPTSTTNNTVSWSTSFTKANSNIHTHAIPFPPSNTAGLFSRAETSPNAPMNFIRKIPPGQNHATPPSNISSPSTSQPPTFTHASSAPPTLPPQPDGVVGGTEGNESRESTPNSPPYPKPGHGLMAKLGLDDEDMEWLVDDNDFEAFSHTVYDERGNATHATSGLIQ